MATTRLSETGHWVFSNKPAGSYGDRVWDHATTLRTKQFYFRLDQQNRRKVRLGDMAILRIFGVGYVGRFEVGEWHNGPGPGEEQNRHQHGYFEMHRVKLWDRHVPQPLVLSELSSKDVRGRLAKISAEDALKIEIAQRIYERLGFGSTERDVIILEKGLEEAIKPNLPRLGLKLGSDAIRQQFSMGVGVGRSDLICEDGCGNLIVLELKRGRSSAEVIGQVLRYVEFVRENIARVGQQVHGWVVTGSYDEGLRLAAKAAGIRLLTVRLP
jgi:hypothetical protein